MPEEKNIKNYNAADIEKYWKGKLNAAEMHAMEKAAMDDPFLADALEGYKNSLSLGSELETLNKKLDAKTGGTAKVVSIGGKKFPWLKVAAAIIIIGGVGILAQQVLLKKDNEQVARIEQEKTPETSEKKDTPAVNIKSANDSLTRKIIVAEGSGLIKSEPLNLTVPDSLKEAVATLNTEKKAELPDIKYKEDVLPIAKPNVKIEEAKQQDDAGRKKDYAESVLADKNAAGAVSQKTKSDNETFANKKAANLFNNRYNYRVVDEQNNPVPFANVTNTRDNVGTYTDIKGNFNLVSSDSIMDVQVRSMGYNAENYRILPGNVNNTLVLKEGDRSQILVDNNRRVSSSVTRKDTALLEEPEVGWGYYNTYVSNNIKIPENVKAKTNNNNVELSFDIDKTGNPVNIKITKSSGCRECDEEAKRLLKEGPKWKHKGKRSKGSVVINVDQ